MCRAGEDSVAFSLRLGKTNVVRAESQQEAAEGVHRMTVQGELTRFAYEKDPCGAEST